jgi:hypothetical protein
LNIKQLGQQQEGNLASSLLKKGESSLFGSLGGLLGLDAMKPDGSTQQAALWVQMASPLGGAPGLGALPLGGANLGNIASLLAGGGSMLPAAGGGLSALFGGGGSGFLSALTGFLPFLADGGDVTPGRAYVVGEKRPEVFVPRSAGTVIPNVPSGGNVTHISQTFHISTPDADSFQKITESNQFCNGRSSIARPDAERQITGRWAGFVFLPTSFCARKRTCKRYTSRKIQSEVSLQNIWE